jgi:hypothetical protein
MALMKGLHQKNNGFSAIKTFSRLHGFACPAGLPKAFGTKESRRFKLAERSTSKSSNVAPASFYAL